LITRLNYKNIRLSKIEVLPTKKKPVVYFIRLANTINRYQRTYITQSRKIKQHQDAILYLKSVQMSRN